MKSKRILSCGTSRGKPRPGLQKALWRSTLDPWHQFGAAGSLHMGSRVPDTVQTSGFHPLKIWKDTFQMETLWRPMTLSSSLPHSLLECTGKLSLCIMLSGALGGIGHFGTWITLKRLFVDKAWHTQEAAQPPQWKVSEVFSESPAQRARRPVLVSLSASAHKENSPTPGISKLCQ